MFNNNVIRFIYDFIIEIIKNFIPERYYIFMNKKVEGALVKVDNFTQQDLCENEKTLSRITIVLFFLSYALIIMKFDRVAMYASITFLIFLFIGTSIRVCINICKSLRNAFCGIIKKGIYLAVFIIFMKLLNLPNITEEVRLLRELIHAYTMEFAIAIFLLFALFLGSILFIVKSFCLIKKVVHYILNEKKLVNTFFSIFMGYVANSIYERFFR